MSGFVRGFRFVFDLIMFVFCLGLLVFLGWLLYLCACFCCVGCYACYLLIVLLQVLYDMVLFSC